MNRIDKAIAEAGESVTRVMDRHGDTVTVRQLGTNWLVEDAAMDACIGVFPSKHDADASAKAINTYLRLKGVTA